MKDQLHRKLQLDKTPKRIISLVPSQTELLVDLGLENDIVGITKFCVHPKQLKTEKTIVGGTKQVHFDKIKQLQPDIILCNKEENTKAMIEELEQIAPVHISDIYTIDDSLELVAMYGVLFEVEENANQLINEILQELQSFKEFIFNHTKLKVAYFIWKKPFMVAANQTFIHEMLQINNFENVFQDVSRYPEVSIEDIKAKKPQLLLLSSEPFPFKESDAIEFQEHVPNTKTVIVDGESFSWYGSRLLKAFEYFKTLRAEI